MCAVCGEAVRMGVGSGSGGGRGGRGGKWVDTEEGKGNVRLPCWGGGLSFVDRV